MLHYNGYEAEGQMKKCHTNYNDARYPQPHAKEARPQLFQKVG